MFLISVTKSDKPEKKLKATFCKCKIKNDCKGSNHKVLNFGQNGSSTYLDHKDNQKKDAYIARHRVNENWDNPLTAGALSRWILWNKTTLSASISDFKKKFNL